MAKKRLTPRQQEWETEYKKLKRRVSDWKHKFHAVPDLPTKPERITKKDIERLKQFKWKNIPEAMKKVWRKEYEYRYENKMPEVYQPKQQYTPPTEQDYFNNPDYGDDYDEEWEEQHPDWADEDGYTPTVDSRAELAEWINKVIYSVVESLPENEVLTGVAERLEDYANQAFWQAEHYNAENNYLSYLQENAEKLHDLALKAIHGRESNGNTYYLEAGGAMALPEFVTILNFNNPISPEESSQYNEANIFGGTFEEKYGV